MAPVVLHYFASVLLQCVFFCPLPVPAFSIATFSSTCSHQPVQNYTSDGTGTERRGKKFLPIITAEAEKLLQWSCNWIRPSRMNLILHPFLHFLSLRFFISSFLLPSSNLHFFLLTNAPSGAWGEKGSATPGAVRKVYVVTSTPRLLTNHSHTHTHTQEDAGWYHGRPEAVFPTPAFFSLFEL